MTEIDHAPACSRPPLLCSSGRYWRCPECGTVVEQQEIVLPPGGKITHTEPGELIESPSGEPLGMAPNVTEVFDIDQAGHTVARFIPPTEDTDDE